MAARGRGYSQSHEWDPMRDDYDNSNYDPQYLDDEVSGHVDLDHSRLYITGIPKGLNSEGLRAAFARYGTLVEVHVSEDPLKRYGLVSYETPGEAKLAMMKLNKTEPLKLNVTVAHKKRNASKRDNSKYPRERHERGWDKEDNSSNASRERPARRDERGGAGVGRRDADDASVGSRNKSRKEDMANGDNTITLDDRTLDMDDAVGFESMDPDLELELERLQLENLKLQQAQLNCKKRMLLRQAKQGQAQASDRKTEFQVTLNSSSNRCVLPGGKKIVLRNGPDNTVDNRDGDSVFATGGGDSLKIPGLQRGQRACVSCGVEADAYCAGCNITPYCSTRCQRRDWTERHKDVCHNLARLTGAGVDIKAEDIIGVEPAAPLRRPRSPTAQKETDPTNQRYPTGNQKDVAANQNDGPGNQRVQAAGKPRQPAPVIQKEPANQRDGPANQKRQTPYSQRQPAYGNQRDGTGYQRDGGGYQKDGAGYQKDGAGYQKDGAGYQRDGNGNQKTQASDNRDQTDSNRQQRKFPPAAAAATFNQKNTRTSNYNSRGGGGGNRPHTDGRRPPLRHELVDQPDDEDWGTASAAPKPPVERVKVAPTPAPAPAPAPAPSPAAAAVRAPPSDLADVTLVRKLVPKNCVIETLPLGSTVLLSVDRLASECRTAAPGFVCLSLHDRYENEYQELCEKYGEECERDGAPYAPSAGDAFSWFNPEDGAWYRARCLGASQAALLDASRVVLLAAGDSCRRLSPRYEAMPEFCCMLLPTPPSTLEVGSNLQCTLLSKTSAGYTVSMEHVDGAAAAGVAELTRWLPEVEYPKPKPAASPVAKPAASPVAKHEASPVAKPAPNVAAAAQATAIPEVERPPVKNNSRVLLVDVTAFDRAFVRPAGTDAQRIFDEVLHAVVLYGQTASPLREPPQKGQVVIGKFEDGLHYRALVKRTNVKQNKYLLEYIEYGNLQVSKLEEIYPCPGGLDVSMRPVMTSQVTLPVKPESALTQPATDCLNKLKDDATELILTIPTGETSAPSGSGVELRATSTNESVNRRLDEMCTPEWKKIEEKGGDVVDEAKVMYSELSHLKLPAAGCELDILDFSTLKAGLVSGCERGLAHARYVFTHLTDKMAQYCNSELGREPYLPKYEELCIAQCPPYPQWFRAVMLTQDSPGSAEAQICYIDYGNVETVPVALLRKMLPEFVRDLPAVATSIEIRGFPKNLTSTMLTKALEFMQVTEEGRGVLRVTSCQPDGSSPDMYVADAPDLLAAMLAP